jgi:guanylate kinase
MTAGVALYGPPAAGKDTVTAALTQLDNRFQRFPVLKSGPGRTAGYHMIGDDQFRALDDRDVVFTWSRYEARYAITHSGLEEFARTDQIPVIHLGSVNAITTVTAVALFTWTIAQLWVNRAISEARAQARQTGDVPARLAAYDQTTYLGPELADLTLDTHTLSAGQAAAAIRELTLRRTHPAGC